MTLRILLSLVEIISIPFWVQVATTSPTPSTPKGKRLSNDLTPVVNACIRTLQCSLWIHAIAEGLVILSAAGFIPPLPTLLLLSDGHSPYITPARAAAGIASILGGILRWRCFREMGKQFTFHVTVVDKHKLITTGPYSFVRHPSYTGALLMHSGSLLWHFLPGSWIRESNVSSTIGFWVALVPSMVLVVQAFQVSLLRCSVEDAILKEQFGKEWENWVDRVPYRLFPGVY